MVETWIIIDALLVLVLAVLEMIYDRGIAEAIDVEGRTEEEDKILHSMQMPWRGYTLTLITFLVYTKFDLSDLEALILLPTNLALYGLLFNIIVSKLWIDKGWFYDRTGHGLRNAVIKLALVIIGFFIIGWIRG